MTHICVSKITIIGSDNGLSPSRRQAIIWPYAGILLIRPSGTNFSEILIEIDVFPFMKRHLKMSSAKCRPFCLGLNVLTDLRLSFSINDCQGSSPEKYEWNHGIVFVVGLNKMLHKQSICRWFGTHDAHVSTYPCHCHEWFLLHTSKRTQNMTFFMFHVSWSF